MSRRTPNVSPREFRTSRRRELSQSSNGLISSSARKARKVTPKHNNSTKPTFSDLSVKRDILRTRSSSPCKRNGNHTVSPRAKLKKQRRSSANIHLTESSDPLITTKKEMSSTHCDDGHWKSTTCQASPIGSLSLKDGLKNRTGSPVNIVTQLSQQLISKQPKKQLILPAISPKVSLDNKTHHDKPLMKKPKLCKSETLGESQISSKENKLTEPSNGPVCSSLIEISERGNETASVHSDESSDEELPNLNNVFEAPSNFDLSIGRLVWVKFRKYPRWPSIICKTDQKKKKAAIKYINYANLPKGLWVKRINLSEFPGDHFTEFLKEIQENRYTTDIHKAIKMVNSYLHEKLSDQSLDPLKYFFPDTNAEEMSYLSDLNSDAESESGEDITDELKDKEFTAVKVKQFRAETQQRIAEREAWLGDLTKLVIEDSIINQKIAEFISRKGRSLKKLADRHSYLGPLTYSTTHQGARLLDHVVSIYEALTESIHLPEWCYTSLLPWAIISGIQKLDRITAKEAEKKYFSDMRTEEEDVNYHEQLTNIIKSTP